MRDLRDPQEVGKMIRTLVMMKLPVLNAADELPSLFIPNYVDPDVITRYGRPGEHQPVWERIQIK